MVVPSLHPSPLMSKAKLRTAMRRARKAYVMSINTEQRARLEHEIAGHLYPLIEKAASVGGYHAVGSEVDVAPMLALAKRHALPAFDGETEVLCFRQGPATIIGPHDIPQPDSSSPKLSCSLILTPLLAIDPAGHRLGQGGGHYDRALPALREAGATLIGVGWDMQLLGFPLPHEAWDIPLDGFVSPSGLRVF